MISKVELEGLAQLRLDDAVFLLAGSKYSSAYYLAGYAVELAIKACIAKLFQANVIPDKNFVQNIYSHKFVELLNYAGLTREMEKDSSSNVELGAFWAIANKWSEASRYREWDVIDATTLVSAVHEPNHGVFQWLKKHW